MVVGDDKADEFSSSIDSTLVFRFTSCVIPTVPSSISFSWSNLRKRFEMLLRRSCVGYVLSSNFDEIDSSDEETDVCDDDDDDDDDDGCTDFFLKFPTWELLPGISSSIPKPEQLFSMRNRIIKTHLATSARRFSGLVGFPVLKFIVIDTSSKVCCWLTVSF